LFHAVELGGELAAPGLREAVGLFLARGVFLFEAFDPRIFKQAAERAVEGAGAQSNAPPAERFDVFEEGIPVARTIGETEQDQQDGLGERLGLDIS
jgi:hypothetical protein